MKSGTNGSLAAGSRKFWFPTLASALLAIPILGMWELFRADRPYATRVSHLLIGFLAFLLLTVIAIATEHFTTRGLLADANVANDRLRMVMASGRSAGWEWDLTSGRDYWFDDLQTMFGVQSDTWSGTVEEFFSVYIPKIASVSRKRWQMQGLIISPTRRNSGSFVGMVRSVWATATGSFYYMKSGKPERMLGMVVDITEHKHAEEELKKSEEKISMAFRESPMALTLTSAKDHRYLMSTRPSNRAQVAPT